MTSNLSHVWFSCEQVGYFLVYSVTKPLSGFRVPIQSQLISPAHREVTMRGQAIAQPTQPKPTQFGNGAVVAEALAGSAKIAHLPLAEGLNRILDIKLLQKDFRKFNLSMEDWAARTMTIIAIYLPQAYLSIKNNKHKWETNGRNLVIWVSTLALAVMVKNDKTSLNTLLNVFMQERNTPFGLLNNKKQLLELALNDTSNKLAKLNPEADKSALKTLKKQQKSFGKSLEKVNQKLSKTTAEAQGSFIHKMLNRFRLPFDYLQLLNTAGVKANKIDLLKAMWASFDNNIMDTLSNNLTEFKAKAPEALTEAERFYVDKTPQFLKRVRNMNLLSTTIMTALTAYIIGKVMMKVVIKFIAPLDHDFDMGEKKGSVTRKPSPPSFSQPLAFQQFHQQKTAGGLF